MVRHTGTRYQPIITHCSKYRIEGIDCMLQTEEQGESGNVITTMALGKMALDRSLPKH